ncbi:MAG TPA: hypothetical protein DC054_14890 [Blastocatellia bacterium]|nr:hypothetical protein [Blastocatellia bacterium]
MILNEKQPTAARTTSAASFTMVTAVPAAQAPQITTLSPSSMPSDSTISQTLVINGGFFKDGATLTFDPPTGSNINSTASKLTFISSTRLSYQLNNGGDHGTWTVMVRNPDGQTSNVVSFMVTTTGQAPQITTLSPGSMPADSTIDQTLVINGGFFKDGASLIFDPPTGSNINSTASKLTFISSTRLSYQLNNGGDHGTWTVTVRNPDGQTSNAVSFTVTTTGQAPQITTLSPGSMAADSTISQTLTINGGFFKDGASLIFDPPTGPNINSTASKLTFISSTRLSYELNNGGDAGMWTVMVRNPDGQTSNAASFRVTGGVTLLRISSVAGRTSGGQQIRLDGVFDNLATVTLGGVSASWIYTNGSDDPSTITVTTPAHSVGAVQVDLAPTSGSSFSKPNAFAYLPTVFSDDTIFAAVTIVRAQHIIELRQAVDALRAVAGLAPAPWTDPSLAPNSTVIKAIHIQELRTYVDDAASRLGYPTQPYTEPGLTTGSSIKRVHIEELRQRIRAIAG